MDPFDFQHSLKNIPIPAKDSYLKLLIGKTEDFIGRLRWATYHFLHPKDPNAKKNPEAPENTYGFPKPGTAPQSQELLNFEHELCDMIADIEFTDVRSKYQNKLAKTVKMINDSDKVFFLADKTTNIYQVSTENYHKLLLENVTKDYRQVTNLEVDNINMEAKSIAQDLKLADRIETFGNAEAYITIKDHKEDYKNKTKCRLINPAKSQIGEISKQILQNVNQELRESTNLKQWQSTKSVLDWFKDIRYHSRKQFLQLDVVEFYPSITEKLLDEAIGFAQEHLDITEQQIKIIKQARKSLLYCRPTTSAPDVPAWTKKNSLFDVTMGAPDGAEVCELVGLLILSKLKVKFKMLDFGLYRDDGLAVHSRMKPHQLDDIRKSLHALFATFDLRITVVTGQTTVDFLDVTLDLTKENFRPYRKENDKPLYVNTGSNHPPNVLKQIPIGINKRLSNISSTRADFDNAKPDYQEALKNSGHDHTLRYEEPKPAVDNKNKDKKKRKIIWFNPPYNQAVKTNIGKKFLQLVSLHFPKNSPLYSLLNRNTVKLSYSCTKNMKAILQAHNKKVLNKSKPVQAAKLCDCQQSRKHLCPIQGECNQRDVIYHVTTDEIPARKYIGSTGAFKARYVNHRHSFRHEHLKTATTLSHHIWDNNLGNDPNLRWQIIGRAPAYKKGNRNCDLCLTEKLHIMRHSSDPHYLNKRTEIALRCRHKATHTLHAFKKVKNK